MATGTQEERIEKALQEVDAALKVARKTAGTDDHITRALQVAEIALQHAWGCSTGVGREQFCMVATAALECALGLSAGGQE